MPGEEYLIYQYGLNYFKGVIRCERELPFPNFLQDSLVNSFTWVGNIVFHSHSQSQKSETLFSFPFTIPNFKKLDWLGPIDNRPPIDMRHQFVKK